MNRSIRIAATLFALSGCFAAAPTNPYDPATPSEQQAAAEISGAIVLPGADGATLELLDANGQPVPGPDNAPRVTSAKAQPSRADAADFAFTGLKPGSYRVAPGRGDARFKAFLAPVVPLVRVGPGERVSLGTLVFTRIDTGTGLVKGQVDLRDAQGGPRDIRLLRRVGGALEQRAALRTAPDGTFSVGSLPPGRYALSAELTGFTTDYRLGFDLAEEPQALANEADFTGAAALVLHSVTAVVVPDLPRPYGTYYTRERALPVQVLAFGAMTEMRLATTPDFVDAAGAELGWSPYAAAASVALPDVQGRVTVHAQFRNDPASEFPFSSDVFEATVVRDSVPPRAVSIAARGLVPEAGGVPWVRDGSKAITFDVEGADAESAVAAFAVHHDAAGSPGNVDALAFDAVDAPGGLVRLSKTFVLTAGDGPKSVWAYFRDRAGNTSDPIELALRVDGTAPVVSPLEVTGALAGNVLDSLSATVRVAVPDVCAGGASGSVDDCPVSVRIGARPLPANAATLPIPVDAFRPRAGGGAAAEFLVPFAAQHGEVVSFEAEFADRAGNVARVASANYTMRLVGRVSGRVLVDGVPDDAAGHAGTAVRLTPMGAAPSDADRSAATAADGTLALEDVPQGRYVAALSRPGAVPQQLGFEVVAGQPTDLGLVRLATARGFVAGRFVRGDLAGDDTAHGGIRVSLLLGDVAVARLVTEPDGSFVVPSPGLPVSSPAAPYRVVAEAQGYRTQSVNDVHVVQGGTAVLSPSAADPSRPSPVALARIGGNVVLCAREGACTPIAHTRSTQLRARLADGAGVTRVRVKVRTPFTEPDAAPWLPYAEGELVPVDVSGADGAVDVYVQAEAGASTATLAARVVLDTVAPAVDAFALEPGPRAAPGFTSLAVVRARVDVAPAAVGSAPLDGARVVFAAAAPAELPSNATRCETGAACSIPLGAGASEGLQRAWAYACDLAGNCSATPAEAAIVYDATPPRRAHGVALAPSSPVLQVVDGKAWTRSPAHDLALSVGTARTDAGAELRGLAGALLPDVAAYRFGAPQADGTIRHGAWIVLDPAAAAATVTVAAPALPPADATHRTYVQLRDLAGNETEAEAASLSYELTLDTTPPEVSLVLDDGAGYTRTGTVRLGVVSSAGDAGPATSVLLSREAGLFDGAERRALPLADVAWDLRAPAAPAGDGLRTVHARFVDSAGNVADRSASIVVDRTAPEFVAASCAGCVVDAVGRAWTSRPELTLSVAVADASSRVERLRVAVDAGPAADLPYAPAVPVVLPAMDGVRTVRLVAVDAAGNASAPRAVPVTLDRAAPDFSVRVGDGAATTPTANVTLALSAADASDFAVMEVSNVATFTGAVRMAFAGSLAWRLAAPDVDGAKEVHVRVTDQAGNVAVRSAAVVLRAAASVSGTVTADGAAAAGVAVSLAGTSAAGASYTASATTDPAGAYAFSPVPAGTYTLTFARHGYETGTLASLPVAAGAEVRAPFVLRRASGVVAGRVVVSAGTSGLAVSQADAQGVAVVVSAPSLPTTYLGITDAAGNYSIVGVPAPLVPGATYVVTATKRGFAPAVGSVGVTAGAVATAADLSLAVAGATVAGCVSVPAPAADSAGVTASLAGVAFNGTALSRTAASPSATAAACGGAGRYAFVAVPDGSYTVTLARAGYASASVSVTVAGADVAPAAAVLSRATGAVAGSVAGAAGGTGLTPNVGQALVTLSGADLLGGTYQATTTATGDWRIDNVPVSPTGAAYTVTVTKTHYAASGAVSVVVLANAVATAPGVTLSLGSGTVAGTVSLPNPPSTDSSGVVATLTGSAFDGTAIARTADAPSSAAGAYAFSRVPPGSYAVQLSATGYQAAIVAGVAVRADATTSVPGQALLRATGALYGRIVASANSSGLAVGAADVSGASVVVSGAGLVGTYAASADANGNWSLAGIPVPVPSASYTVTVAKAGFVGANTTAVVAANGNSPVPDVTLGVATYALSGTATLEGSASAAGVTATLAGVAFNGASYTATAAPTQASGAFSFAAVPAGSYTVTLAGSASYLPKTLPAVTVAPPPSVIPVLSGTLPRAAGAVTGRVLVSAGATGLALTPNDATGVSVIVSDASLSTRYAAFTDAAGNYSITGIPCPTTPGAAYVVEVWKAGFEPATGAVVVSAAGAARVPDVTLVATSSEIKGTAFVTSPATSAAGLTVSLSGKAFNGATYTAAALTTVSGKEAIFRFPAVPDGDGPYVLTASSPGFVPVTQPVEIVGVDVIDVALGLVDRATGSLSGTVSVLAGSSGLSIGAAERAGAVVTVSGADLAPRTFRAQTDATGAFVVADVPVNVTAPYQVTVSRSNFVASAPVTTSVTAGASTEVTGLSITVATGEIPVVAELHDRVLDGDPVTYGAATVTLKGAAFNGAAVGPFTATTSPSNGSALFADLPAGVYALQATLAQHQGPEAPNVTLGAGQRAPTVTLALTDTAAPTAPLVAATRRTPTSAGSTSLTLLSASSDPTLPVANLRDYRVRICSPTCATRPVEGGLADAGSGGSGGSAGGGSIVSGGGGAAAPGIVFSWDGEPTATFPLVGGVDNYLTVWARDWNGNAGPGVTLPPIRVETRVPPAPAALRVDNRPGSVRVSWGAVTAPGSLPVAGYKVYYGGFRSTNKADFRGDFASQGPSPVDVGAQTSVTLTGLPDASPFYVAVVAYDGAVDPAPNESALSAVVLANPNRMPLDRAARVRVDDFAKSMVNQRDVLFVASGRTPPYKVQAFRYDAYDALTRLGNGLSHPRARTLVADDHRTLYAYDPSGEGLAVLDAANPAAIEVAADNLLSRKRVYQFVPAHRPGTDGRSHHFVAYKDLTTGRYRLGTVSTAADHRVVEASLDATTPRDLNTQAIPRQIGVVGRNVYVRYGGTSEAGFVESGRVEVYSVDEAFTAITYHASTSTFPGIDDATMTIDHPSAYVSVGNLIHAVDIQGTNSIGVNLARVAATAYPIARMAVSGGLLYALQTPSTGITLAEVFRIDTPGMPVSAGTYLLNQSYENGIATRGLDLAFHGNSAFLLSASVSFTDPESFVDVVELGNPRSMSRVSALYPDGLAGVNVVSRGSRLFMTAAKQSNAEFVDADMRKAFATFDSGPSGGGFTKALLSAHPRGNPYLPPRTMPLALYGDHAFVASYALSDDRIEVFDISRPLPISGGMSVDQLRPVKPPGAATVMVTGLAAANDYLVASLTFFDLLGNELTSNVPYLQRWDLASSRNSVPPSPVAVVGGTRPGAWTVDLHGKYAYVGTKDAFCRVDYLSMVETACFTPKNYSAQAAWVSSIQASGGVLTLARMPRSGVSNLSMLRYSLGDETAAPTLIGEFTLGTTPPLYAVPADAQAFGPTLFVSQGASSNFEGVTSFDLSLGVPAITAAVPLAMPNHGRMAVAGPYLIVPSFLAGTTVYQMY